MKIFKMSVKTTIRISFFFKLSQERLCQSNFLHSIVLPLLWELAFTPTTLSKRGSNADVFLLNLQNFYEPRFWTTVNDCFWIILSFDQIYTFQTIYLSWKLHSQACNSFHHFWSLFVNWYYISSFNNLKLRVFLPRASSCVIWSEQTHQNFYDSVFVCLQRHIWNLVQYLKWVFCENS